MSRYLKRTPGYDGRLVENGGNVVWCSMPPMIDNEGNYCTHAWQSLFNVTYAFDEYLGEMAPGKKIIFQQSFSDIPEQLIMTDFLVDRIYPVSVNSSNTEVVAKVEDQIVGTKVKKGKGYAYYCGFRPRDDQSASLGYETRTLFEILNTIGSYPSSGKFEENDNPTYLSRNSDFCKQFP